jgi:alpha-beta hydrolase superfamily lysophospholipase
MKRFNLKSDGIFVLGSSMGGLSSFQIVQSESFPVIAQVANCPVIDLFKQAYCNPWTSTTYQRSKIAYYFGFEGVQPTFTAAKHIPSKEEVDYFVSNFSKIVSYSPVFANITSGNIFSTVNEIPNNAISANSAEAALYAQLTATHPCPLLIIHNKDDATVSYRYSEYFTQMLQRGGADVSLKLYESGGHNAWANGANGEIKNHKGETILLSESQRLAIEFFKKYE